jgi:proton-translocating NADH-quinone oxidoreductase chain N
MDSILLKSFLPEVFLSLSILTQLIYNSKIINSARMNFPVISGEVYNQTVFILILVFFLLYSIKVEGLFSNFLFINDSGVRCIKLIITFFFISSLYILQKGFIIQQLNFIEIYSVLLLSLLSMFLIVCSLDLITFYLSVEMQALCFYILASLKRDSVFSTEAGLKYFISGSFMSSFFLLGSSFIYGCLGTLNLHDLGLILSYPLSSWSVEFQFLLFFGILCVTSTILFKLVCAPFHFWAPDVYEGSPLLSTVFFSIIPKVSILCFLFKWFSCLNNAFNVDSIALCCGVFSIFLGTFFSLRQKRLKRLLVYSSIAQVGFIVSSCSLNTFGGFSSSLFYICVYMITSLVIWGFFLSFHYNQYQFFSFYNNTVSSLFLTTFSGLYKYNIFWSVCCALSLFSIAGIPPLTGFIAKLFVLFYLIDSSYIFTSVLIILISSVSVFYYIRVIKILFFEPLVKDVSITPSHVVFLSSHDASLYSIIVLNLFLLVFIFFFPTELFLFTEFIILNFLVF